MQISHFLQHFHIISGIKQATVWHAILSYHLTTQIHNTDLLQKNYWATSVHL